MWLVLLALGAEFLQFQAILQNLLVLGRTVVQGFTHCALEFDQVVLGHTAFRTYSFGLFSTHIVANSLIVRFVRLTNFAPRSSKLASNEKVLVIKMLAKVYGNPKELSILVES